MNSDRATRTLTQSRPMVYFVIMSDDWYIFHVLHNMQVNLHVMLSLVHMVNVSAAMVLCKQDAPVTNVYACVVL